VLDPEGFVLPTVDGCEYHVPAGSFLAISHIVPHRNERLFPQPLDFRPHQRFAEPIDEYQLTTFRFSPLFFL
jgi:cytochrome P450